jgi:uncharacterized protein (AIM24 family)
MKTMTARQRVSRESRSIVRIDVDGSAWISPGAAIAYSGRIAFERLPTLGASSPRDVLFRETAPLVQALGRGTLFVGHHGLHAQIVELEGDSLVVAWDNLLAFESSLTFDMALGEPAMAVAAGALIVVKLSGHGAIAIGTHGEPVTLMVRRDDSVTTDPRAVVAWSGGVSASLQTDVTWRTAVGHGGGQPIQVRFEGEGHVMVQSSRKTAPALRGLEALRRIADFASV